MSACNPDKMRALNVATRTMHTYRRECPKLEGEVDFVQANFIATVNHPRDGSVVIDTDSLHKAQMACTRLSATPGDPHLYSLIDERTCEIVAVGAEIPVSGELMAPVGPFLRAYRLIEKAGQERWTLRPVLILVAATTVEEVPTAYPDALVSIGKSPRGNSYRLKPWRWLTEGRNKNHPGGIMRVQV